ncbi:hypothetical protein BJP24_19000 [Aeromonas allosaccharophila]|uniref:hypothetical protein n=1 Tax=Aeromonas allosaccharophila TaxID=656 RepID=UPI0005B1F404|nr:hypothetical protein [Aeromonas allosaccharophila]OKP42699.1 hypothetical protein BJP24_19000 [Aeromonas allosaccharophila]
MTFHRLAFFLLLCSLSLLAAPLRASDVFTHISPESERDQRTLYFRDLLQLALEKTRDSFGDYELRAAPPMNRVRMRQVVQTRQYPNLFVADSQRPAAESGELDYVRFPVELGILGYRICFVSPQQADVVARVNTLAQLQQFLHGQGRGWQDAEILRHGGFKVQEIDSYERLFKLVARGRIDLFCRGANELFIEQEQHSDLPDLIVDRRVALNYPFLHLFYTHRDNQAAIRRISVGLKLAWQDGSLQQLWLRHFKPSLDQAQLSKRLLFELANPRLDKVDFDYRAYHYNPVNGTFGPGLP